MLSTNIDNQLCHKWKIIAIYLIQKILFRINKLPINIHWFNFVIKHQLYCLTGTYMLHHSRSCDSAFRLEASQRGNIDTFRNTCAPTIMEKYRSSHLLHFCLCEFLAKLCAWCKNNFVFCVYVVSGFQLLDFTRHPLSWISLVWAWPWQRQALKNSLVPFTPVPIPRRWAQTAVSVLSRQKWQVTLSAQYRISPTRRTVCDASLQSAGWASLEEGLMCWLANCPINDADFDGVWLVLLLSGVACVCG